MLFGVLTTLVCRATVTFFSSGYEAVADYSLHLIVSQWWNDGITRSLFITLTYMYNDNYHFMGRAVRLFPVLIALAVMLPSCCHSQRNDSSD